MRKIIFTIIVLAAWYLPLFAQEDFWEQTGDLYGADVYAIATDSIGNIYAGTNNGLFKSINNGDNWEQIGFTNTKINCIAINSSDEIFIGTNLQGIFISTDSGINWINIGLENEYIQSLTITNKDIILVATGRGVSKTTDRGKNWFTTSLKYFSIHTFCSTKNGDILAGGEGVFRSTNNGVDWSEIDNLEWGSGIRTIVVNSNDEIFIGDSWGNIQKSINNGENWSIVFSIHREVSSIVITSSGEIFAGLISGIYKSSDNGNNWIENGLKDSWINCLFHNTSGEIFAGINGGGFYISSDNGNTWIQKSKGLKSNNNITAISSSSKGDIFAGVYGCGVYRSTDFGNTWTQTALNDQWVRTILITSNDKIIVGCDSSDLFSSTDFGVSWEKINLETRENYIFALAKNSKNYLIAGGWGGLIFMSTDNGVLWSKIIADSNYIRTISLTVNSKDQIIVGTDYDGIYKTTNDGINWLKCDTLKDHYIRSLAVNSDDDIFAGSFWIYRSTDEATHWFQVLGGVSLIYSIVLNSNDYIYAGTDSNGVFLSTNNGLNWTQINNGLSDKHINSLHINTDGYIFAGTEYGCVFRSKKSTTSVKDNISNSLFLTQNFPNPFRTNTEIKFNIQYPDYVTLIIFDELGKEIKTVVNDYLDSGENTAQFDGTGLSTGVYYYCLRTSKGTETKKMIYIAE